MAGVFLAPLTERDLERLQSWYLAYQLAEENSPADDELSAKLKRYHYQVACGTCKSTGPTCDSDRSDTNERRSEAWGSCDT